MNEPDVGVVHPDPRLDEEHPVDEGDDRDEDADRPAAEQDPGEQVQEARHRGAREDARQPPGELVVPDVDARDLAGRGERQDLLAVVGRGVAASSPSPRRTGRTGAAASANTACRGALDDVDRRGRRRPGVRPRTWTISVASS